MKLTKQNLREMIKEEIAEMKRPFVTAGAPGQQLQQISPIQQGFVSDLENIKKHLIDKLSEEKYTHGSDTDYKNAIQDRLQDLQQLWNWLDGAPVR